MAYDCYRNTSLLEPYESDIFETLIEVSKCIGWTKLEKYRIENSASRNINEIFYKGNSNLNFQHNLKLSQIRICTIPVEDQILFKIIKFSLVEF